MTETKSPEHDEVLSPDELANYLKCGRTYAYQLLAKGEIPSFKIGKLRRIRRADVEQYVEERAYAAGDR